MNGEGVEKEKTPDGETTRKELQGSEHRLTPSCLEKHDAPIISYRPKVKQSGIEAR